MCFVLCLYCSVSIRPAMLPMLRASVLSTSSASRKASSNALFAFCKASAIWRVLSEDIKVLSSMLLVGLFRFNAFIVRHINTLCRCFCAPCNYFFARSIRRSSQAFRLSPAASANWSAFANLAGVVRRLARTSFASPGAFGGRPMGFGCSVFVFCPVGSINSIPIKFQQQ